MKYSFDFFQPLQVLTMLNSQAAQNQVAAGCGQGLPIPILLLWDKWLLRVGRDIISNKAPLKSIS